MSNEPDKQRSPVPYTPTMFPLSRIPGVPPDSPNRLDPGGLSDGLPALGAVSSAGALLDNPYAAETSIAAANLGIDPQASASSGFFGALRSGLSALGGFGWKTDLAVGIGIGLAVWLAVSLSSSSKNTSPVTVPAHVTPAVAMVLQKNVDTSLAAADKDLAKAGLSAEAMAQAHNEVKIADGSQIALSVRPTSGELAMPKSVIVTGSTGPGHYAGLATVDANRYVSTLSPAPTLSDLTVNSAVVHGLKTNQ